MKLIMQPTFSTCGQACIAMIAGKSVEEVIRDMKTDGATSIGQLWKDKLFEQYLRERR